MRFLVFFLCLSVCGFCASKKKPIKGPPPKEVLPQNVFFPEREFRSGFPHITGQTFRAFSHHIFDPLNKLSPETVQPGDLIFCFRDYLNYFFSVLHPKIQHPYILITHHFFGESDLSIPGDELVPFLEDEKLIAWFGINIDRKHPKLFPLPIGVSSPFYKTGGAQLLDKYYVLKEKVEKKYLLYLNFGLHTYPKERHYIYELFRNRPYCFSVLYDSDRNIVYPRTQEQFFQDLVLSKFVLSPRGNGLDCFRTWEALHMGAYPIVKTSILDSLYEDLPVVIIKEWDELTEEFLENKYKELQSKEFDYDRLFMPFWLKKIQEVRSAYFISKAKNLNANIEEINPVGNDISQHR